MRSAGARATVLALSALLVFVSVVALLLRAMPGNLRELDYLVIGAAATFASLLLLFVFLTATWMKRSNLLYKQKRRSSGHLDG